VPPTIVRRPQTADGCFGSGSGPLQPSHDGKRATGSFDGSVLRNVRNEHHDDGLSQRLTGVKRWRSENAADPQSNFRLIRSFRQLKPTAAIENPSLLGILTTALGPKSLPNQELGTAARASISSRAPGTARPLTKAAVIAGGFGR
jgi:hypothetical protein